MKEISFYPSSKEVEIMIPPPKPARHYVQNWYKDTKYFRKTGTPEYENGVIKNISVKACPPFHDAMTSGYIQETWCDIYINKITDDSIEYHYAGLPKIIEHRETQNIPEKDFYYNVELAWISPWIPKTPKGYSVLCTTPQNFILPFKTFSAIIDSDNFYHTLNGLVPFYIKNGFSGLIPAGTPMYQFIMIKRDDWKHNVEKWNEEQAMSRYSQRLKMFHGFYKKNFHVAKKFL